MAFRTSTALPGGRAVSERLEQHRVLPAEDLPTESPPAMRFAREVASFQRSVGTQRDAARGTIVRRILTADDPDEYVGTVLQTLLSSRRPGRLDDAIDILSATGPVVATFICEMLSQPQVTEVDEDYWYVLIRALGRSQIPAARMFIDLLWQKSPEAAVEALGDLGNAESIARLRTIAGSDGSDRIRQLAADIIEECSQ